MNSINWLCATLQVELATERGMYGSGVLMINPPWTLEDSLSDTLPELANLLGQDRAAGFTLDTHTPSNPAPA